MSKSKKEFYASETRGVRGVERTQFHMLLAKEEREKLTRLTHKHKMSAADVVRFLIIEAA